MKHVQAITLLLFLSIMGLSGCDQVKDLAAQEMDKAKKEIISEITKTVNGSGDQDKKKEGQPNKEADREEGEKNKQQGDRQ
jgi:hypothetical protein